jgi:hypothetical protein
MNISKTNPESLKRAEPFSALFPANAATADAISASMARDGFDPAFPIIAWNGVVVDGNTRLAAAKKAKLREVYYIDHQFDDEDAAVAYAIACQRNRRNLTDADILRCVTELDKRKSKADTLKRGDESPEATSVATGKTAAATAEIIGTNRGKVEKARTVLDRAEPETKAAVLAGEKSINAAYRETVGAAPPPAAPVASEPETVADDSGHIPAAKVLPAAIKKLDKLVYRCEPAERKHLLNGLYEWIMKENRGVAK